MHLMDFGGRCGLCNKYPNFVRFVGVGVKLTSGVMSSCHSPPHLPMFDEGVDEANKL